MPASPSRTSCSGSRSVAAIPFKVSLIDQAEELVDQRLKNEVRMIEGARDAIASVTTKRCICSNSRSERIGFMLDKTGLAPFFTGRIFSSLETPSGKPKPAPDVFLHAAATLGANPANTFVIEDSVARHRRRQDGRHARHRLHRRCPQLSRPCRRSDRSRCRDGDPALGGFPRRDRGAVGMVGRRL